MFERGAVVEVKQGGSAWRGSVRSGSRPVRVSVVVRSATDFETHCSCPANRSTGELCGHAVATGLAALAGGVGGASAPAEKPVKSLPPVMAWEVLFPPNWQTALGHGVLSASLRQSADAERCPEDDRISAWLGREGVAVKSPLNLQLDGARASGFLDVLSGHPRVVVGKERSLVAVSLGQRIPMADVSRKNGGVRLVPEPESGLWREIGGVLWKATDGGLDRLGAGAAPGVVAEVLGDLSGGRPVQVPMERFLNHVDVWQDWLRIPDGSWLEVLHFIPAAVSIRLSLEGSLQYLEAGLGAQYADSPPQVPGLGAISGLPRMVGERCEVRNLAAEEAAESRLLAAGFEEEDRGAGLWVLRGEPAVIRFLTRDLPSLRDQWLVTEGPRFGVASKQVVVVSPQIDILGSGEDWLEFDLRFQTSAGVDIPVAEVRRLLRSGAGGVKVRGGRRVVLSDEVAELVEPMLSELDLRQERGHYMASARSGEVVLKLQKNFDKTNKSKELSVPVELDIPDSLHAELRPYQKGGFEWLADRVERFGGALLADDMGLGKTVQTIALIERAFSQPENDSGLVLVVATASLLGNWRAEFSRFAPGRVLRILHGSSRDAEREKLKSGEVVVTSYGTLARDLAWHLRQDYRCIVVDEASLMRNPDTDHAKAVSKLRGRRRIALSGTPIENGIRDLWSIFRFIQPGWLGTREEFSERYEQALADGAEAAGVMRRLRLKTQPFLLRRTKEQVAPELPSKIQIDEICDLSADQQSVYKEFLVEGRKRVEAMVDAKNQGAARMQMLTTLLRLRQTCCDLALLGSDQLKQLLISKRSGKLQRLLELLEEAVNGGHRVLVFSQFQKQLLEIEKCVSERGWDSLRLDGQTRNRQQLVDKFQSPEGPPIFLISLKAGGYGLNLTAADTVIHYDPWWNPAAEAQATDRAHRIGQTRPVTVYRLLTRGTVEEKVVRLQAKKRELAAAIDEQGAGDGAGWSLEDLKRVISED